MTKNQESQIQAVCEAFANGLRAALGEKLCGAYVYGAAAFPDTLPTGDIDFHVILNEPLTGDERGRLYEMHDALARDYPPLGGELDGYYILLDDARTVEPPVSEMWKRATDNAWALHCAHVRAGRCMTLHGPDPAEIYPAVRWALIEAALQGELAYVEEHLGEYPDYCILNLCRLVYSYETRDVVVSKDAASEWARARFPRWAPLIELARRSYSRQGTSAEREIMLSEVSGLYTFACERIERGADGRHS